MFNKHFFAFIACCSLAAAILFVAFTPPHNLENQVKTPTKTMVKTDPNPVSCDCTFSSGGCANCTCVGGFATGCGGGGKSGLREESALSPHLSMSNNQLRQALKYQRLLLSLDSPEAIAAASEVSQLIEAIQDGKTDLYAQVAEQYAQTHIKLPKYEKEMVDTWIDHKKTMLDKVPDEKSSEKLDKN
jgi:hypothetical protein